MNLMQRHNRFGRHLNLSLPAYRFAPLFALGFLVLWATAEPAAKHDQDVDFISILDALAGRIH